MEEAHYRQILVNMLVKDGTDTEVLEDLADKITECVNEQSDKDVIREVEVRVN
jgi:hypothetical protein